jgi:hypothetical protein
LLIGTLVLLVVLVGLLVAADRVAVGFAEKAIAQQVTKEAAKQNVQSADPDVEVGGFPFLTQVAAGRYESVTIHLRDVRGDVEGRSVALPRLDVHARDVTASLDTLRTGQGQVTAGTVEGVGTISYDSVVAAIDQKGVRLAEQGGKLAVTAPLSVLGVNLTVQGVATITVDKGKVALKFEDLAADGLPDIPLARAALNSYARQLSVNVPLPALPFGLTVQDVKPVADGLAVTATASNVPLNAANR